MIRNVYRNLNKARRDPRAFVWSLTAPPRRKDGTIGAGKGKLLEHVSHVVLLSPRGVCTGSLRTIATKGERSVAAWIQGERGTTAPPGERRLITMNPLPPSKGGRSSVEFTYCRVEGGALVIEGPVIWPEVKAVEFTPAGAYAIH